MLGKNVPTSSNGGNLASFFLDNHLLSENPHKNPRVFTLPSYEVGSMICFCGRVFGVDGFKIMAPFIVY